MARRTGSSSFDESARKFTTSITRRLKIEKRLSKERKPEPEPEPAWRYVEGYSPNPPPRPHFFLASKS